MWNARYFFIGDGLHLLTFMVEQGLSVIGARVPGAYVDRVRESYDIPDLATWQDKAGLVADLQRSPFDVLISCGNPFLIPTEALHDDQRKLVNVHPSFLPYLRGPYPLSGALLHGSGAGASLHRMTQVVDGGPLIARVALEVSPEMDWALLHHLTSDTILEAFTQAFHRAFEPDPALGNVGPGSDFRVEERDLELDVRGDLAQTLTRIRAYGQPGLGMRFTHDDTRYVVYRADSFRNDVLARMHASREDGTVVSVYGSTVIVKKGDQFLRLSDVQPLEAAPPSLALHPGAPLADRAAS
ncbi:MAG: formyltransferase family protein [Pseudomonadota bacterium]